MKGQEAINEAVDHPKHYQDPSGIECIDIVRHRNFDIGNAIKYLWRAGLKQDADKTPVQKQIEDLEKAIWYIKDEIKMLEAKCKLQPGKENSKTEREIYEAQEK